MCASVRREHAKHPSIPSPKNFEKKMKIEGNIPNIHNKSKIFFYFPSILHIQGLSPKTA
jgi:hypothetical protein